MALAEMGFGRNGYWPNWELDQVALDEMALDEMGLDEMAISRISNGNINARSENQFFAVNLRLKLFRATVTNTDIGSLKSLHKFITKCLYHLLVEFEQNHMVQTTQNFKLF